MTSIRIRLVWALVWTIMCAPLAQAQIAPDGNAYPEDQSLSAIDADNPFGVAAFDPENIASTEEKLAFAAELDLDALRRLAVFHNGRIKIIDTLATETVSVMTGRKHFTLRDSEGNKLKFDPLFTWLDLIIDPGYYLDKPLIHVNYLPLRREYLELAFPGDEIMQERWMLSTRITPIMAQQFGPLLEDKYAFDLPYRQGSSEIRGALGLWRDSANNLLLVVPAQREDPWGHLTDLPADHRARVAARDLGAAWRAADAGGVNNAVATLAEILPAINADVYPSRRASLEMGYNSINAFEWGSWLYFLSFLALLLSFGTGRKWLVNTGAALLLLAIVLHAFGFLTRCMIAERFAIQNQYESMIGVSLFAAIVGFSLAVARRQWLFGAAAGGTGFLILITATQTGIPGEQISREAAILSTSVLLKYHVTTVLVSYGLITLGFLVSLFYLGTHYAHKFGPAGGSGLVGGAALGQGSATPARVLHDLDRAQMTVLRLAFLTLATGILLGAWWADHSWGRWWAFDPKETWALVTWIIYLMVIHLRLTTTKNRALITAWLSVVGFVVMLWTYFGVNLLLPGLHAYA